MDTVRFDCIIEAGEIDTECYGEYLDNDLRVYEVVKHNVTGEEALEWLKSTGRSKRVFELQEIGRKKLGYDYVLKYSVDCYYTLAHKD